MQVSEGLETAVTLQFPERRYEAITHEFAITACLCPICQYKEMRQLQRNFLLSKLPGSPDRGLNTDEV